MGSTKSDKNLDQVRELIFGEQIRQNQRKFSSIDERLDEMKNAISAAANEAHKGFKKTEKESQKLQDRLKSRIEKAKKELSDSLETTKNQILRKIDQLNQEKSDRMELGNLLIELGMRIKGEDLMETLKKEAKT